MAAPRHPDYNPTSVWWKERFWQHVQQGGTDECWPWRGANTPGGYGLFSIAQGGRHHYRSAPRIALETDLGRSLAKSELACHTCDVPSCCNPGHLYVGTVRENMLDKVLRGRTVGLLKITYDQVEDIRSAVAEGSTHRSQAEAYGVSRPLVTMIVGGKRRTVGPATD